MYPEGFERYGIRGRPNSPTIVNREIAFVGVTISISDEFSKRAQYSITTENR